MLHRIFCLLAATLLLMTGVCAGAENQFVFSFMPTRQHEGVTYEGRTTNSLTTVLLLGYDHKDEGELDVPQEGFIRGGQSDCMLLLVVDHDAKKIRQLQFDRDTITEIKFYSKTGSYYGERRLQICLAHAYGDTQEMNNRNAVWAVENLLGIAQENDGAQIDMYMSMDITGIGRLNDLLGGVTVPIEDDFSHYDPSMVQGTTMKLDGAQAQIYCRQRYYIGDQSNASRMKRQRIYMDAALEQLRAKVKDNPAFAKELLNGMGLIFDTSKDIDAGFGFTTTDKSGTPVTNTPTHYLMVNKSLDTIVGLLSRAINYEVLPVEELPGERSVGASGYIEYKVEKETGLKWALDALYRPLN